MGLVRLRDIVDLFVGETFFERCNKLVGPIFLVDPKKRSANPRCNSQEGDLDLNDEQCLAAWNKETHLSHKQFPLTVEGSHSHQTSAVRASLETSILSDLLDPIDNRLVSLAKRLEAGVTEVATSGFVLFGQWSGQTSGLYRSMRTLDARGLECQRESHSKQTTE